MTRVLELPLDKLEALVDRIEAQPTPVEFMQVRELMLLVHGAAQEVQS